MACQVGPGVLVLYQIWKHNANYTTGLFPLVSSSLPVSVLDSTSRSSVLPTPLVLVSSPALNRLLWNLLGALLQTKWMASAQEVSR
jgi:hypothetical protein